MSVFDKAGLDGFVRGLLSAVPDALILSTGGTFAALEKSLGASAARSLRQVSDYTGQPEMQGGLVKTLDFKIYLGLLAETYNPEHQKDLSRAGAAHIDMVVVNLYPFEKASSAAGATLEDARANIDIGGPCMIRAAAKNFHRVAAVTDPGEYAAILRELSRKPGHLGTGHPLPPGPRGLPAHRPLRRGHRGLPRRSGSRERLCRLHGQEGKLMAQPARFQERLPAHHGRPFPRQDGDQLHRRSRPADPRL